MDINNEQFSFLIQCAYMRIIFLYKNIIPRNEIKSKMEYLLVHTIEKITRLIKKILCILQKNMLYSEMKLVQNIRK